MADRMEISDPNSLSMMLFHGSNATVPTRAHAGDAGYDLYAAEEVVVKPLPHLPVKIKTEIKGKLPDGYFCAVEQKSGLFLKGILTLKGTIDTGYQGDYTVVAMNVGTEDYTVKKGQAIAQLIFYPRYAVHMFTVPSDLPKEEASSRGSGAFGSTGLFKEEQ